MADNKSSKIQSSLSLRLIKLAEFQRTHQNINSLPIRQPIMNLSNQIPSGLSFHQIPKFRRISGLADQRNPSQNLPSIQGCRSPNFMPTDFHRSRSEKIEVSEISEVAGLQGNVNECWSFKPANESTDQMIYWMKRCGEGDSSVLQVAEIQKTSEEGLDSFVDYLTDLNERMKNLSLNELPESLDDCVPAANFRSLSLYPTHEDLTCHQLEIEPNKIVGRYECVEHYLDVQFRLLRADFMESVRIGLQEYAMRSRSAKSETLKYEYNGVRIFPHSRFEKIQCSRNRKIGILLNFDSTGRMKNVQWRQSKLLMHGSLLLLTADDFSSTFFCCTVLERTSKTLESGRILVTRPENVEFDTLFENAFLMAEAITYFEPYFYVMKSLIDLGSNNRPSIPMAKYIVQGETETAHPAFLSNCDVWNASLVFDMWPTADELKMDDFQHRAFKAALTRNFCVIQGPPGTGKTFVGLKIVQTILKMAPFCHNVRLLPILIVCHSNHGLDQFLKGVLKLTQKVVRVGGQSRCKTMQRYNIRSRGNLPQHLQRSSKMPAVLIGRIEILRTHIDVIGQKLECVASRSGLLRLSLLRTVENSGVGCFKNDEHLQSWLLDEEDANDKSLSPTYSEWWDDCIELPFEECILETRGEKRKFDETVEEDVDAVSCVGEDDFFDGDEEADHLDDPIYCSVTVEQLKQQCRALANEHSAYLRKIETISKTEGSLQADDIDEPHLHKRRLDHLVRRLKNLKENLVLSHSWPADQQRSFVDQNFLLTSRPQQRWSFYWSLVSKLRKSLFERLFELEKEYRVVTAEYENFQRELDIAVMKDADFVGMTTSGAARFNTQLKSLRPAVVVIEEAGQVLESHVVISLTDGCQQVILIGDHKQLKPNTATPELSTKYCMNVSLFERIYKNGINCLALNVQHRMRPEISSLIAPLIYPNLRDHESVMNIESVEGVARNVFFVDHNAFEQGDDSYASKQNPHEAEFVVKLARYLMRRGYSADNITILTLYSAQKLLLLNLKKEYLPDHGVRCVVVDEYQGEENDIVLLSLVRSNENGVIGFLNVENRVCVALSRARKGLYIVGNMGCMTKRSILWRNIEKILIKEDAIGAQLPLYCKAHAKSTFVTSGNDFEKVESNGCGTVCGSSMKCGHKCRLLCHLINEKDEILCAACDGPSENSSFKKHRCRFYCFEKCMKCCGAIYSTLSNVKVGDVSMHDTKIQPRNVEILRRQLKSVTSPAGLLCLSLLRSVINFDFVPNDEKLQAWLLDEFDDENSHKEYVWEDYFEIPFEEYIFMETEISEEDIKFEKRDRGKLNVFSAIEDKLAQSCIAGEVDEIESYYSVTVEELKLQCRAAVNAHLSILKDAQVIFVNTGSLNDFYAKKLACSKRRMDRMSKRFCKLKKNMENPLTGNYSEATKYLFKCPNLYMLPSRIRWSAYWALVRQLENRLLEQFTAAVERYE